MCPDVPRNARLCPWRCKVYGKVEALMSLVK
jgi:hypothetical protein